jgi:hypothetical protein
MAPPSYKNPQRPPPNPKKPTQDEKWTSFTYFGKETKLITKLSKTPQLRSHTQHVTLSTDYSPHKNTRRKTGTKYQAYID